MPIRKKSNILILSNSLSVNTPVTFSSQYKLPLYKAVPGSQKFRLIRELS